MLINCPECNKEISDKSEVCISCGYPIKQYLQDQENEKLKDNPNICFIGGQPRNLSEFLEQLNNGVAPGVVHGNLFKKADKEGWLGDILGGVSDLIMNYMVEYHEIPRSLEANKPTSYIQPQVPKCPTCGSTNIKNISGTKRWLSTGIFGLASSNIGKTMVCGSCGYKW